MILELRVRRAELSRTALTFFHRHGRPRRRPRVPARIDAVVQVGLGVAPEHLVLVRRGAGGGGVAVCQFGERQFLHASGRQGIAFQD